MDTSCHNKIGTGAKEERLRYLRNLWVGHARKMKGLTVLTPDHKKMVAALTSFRLEDVVTTKANDAVTTHLAEKIFNHPIAPTSISSITIYRIHPA
jgi:selenocysteine lyase/cysteine desulfurase